MMFGSWLCARMPRLYRNVLSQRIEMSGLPVSISNACAAPLAASIEATASDAARRRNRVPAAMGCVRYCILILPLWLKVIQRSFETVMPRESADNTPAPGLSTRLISLRFMELPGLASFRRADHRFGREIHDAREELAELFVVIDRE